MKKTNIMDYWKKIWSFFRFVIHVLTARHTKGHGVHSPSLFYFVRFVIYESNPFYVFDKIEKVRKELLADGSMITLNDYGTSLRSKRKISDIAAKSLKSPRYAQLLYRIVRYSKPKTILELGTSLGLTTSYLALGSSSDSICYTFEGSENVVSIARNTFNKLQLNNINVVEGNIDVTLTEVLSKLSSVDFVFIDANHKKEAVLSYFDKILEKVTPNSIVVVDDINWSKDMSNCWTQLKKYPQVTTTLDLFYFGIVFFDNNLNKEHYKLCY